MDLVTIVIDPLSDYGFMRRALVASVALACCGAPLGVLMMLRRLTLVGDALGHALLPGIAAGAMAFGLSLASMTLGGLAAALLVAVSSVFLTRFTHLKEDGAFTLLYLLSLSVGVMLVSFYGGSGVELTHLLFGNVLAVDEPALLWVVGLSCVTVLSLAALYRHLVFDGFDPVFLGLSSSPRRAQLIRLFFFALLMANLVAAFQAMGTLMALGLMLLPALAARFWTQNIDWLFPLAMGFAVVSAVAGLLLSFHANLPSGPSIVLIAGGFALVSSFVGRVGSVLTHQAGR